jgi:ribosomal protein L40E
MAKKKTGYVELYWTCPNCSGENLGSTRICPSCGAPQPKNAEFHQAKTQQIITDADKLKKARSGADIHCGFCGARNPASAVKCSQCGSDLKEGQKRGSAGRVVGAFKAGAAEPIKCPSCGTLNAGERLKCENCGTALSRKVKLEGPAASQAPTGKAVPRLLGILGIGVLLLCAAVYFLFFRTSEIRGEVVASRWERSVAIEAFGPVEREGWLDAIPVEAEVLSCSERVSSTQDQPPASGAYNEVCGTPYTVDSGNGFAEVVQDCQYEVLADYCSYTINDWAAVDTVAESGTGLSAFWPEPNLAEGERLGVQEEDYVCVFDANGERYSFSTDSFNLYRQCEPGSVWVLDVNALGGVQSIKPAN